MSMVITLPSRNRIVVHLFTHPPCGPTQVGATQVGETQVGETQVGETQVGATHDCETQVVIAPGPTKEAEVQVETAPGPTAHLPQRGGRP